MSDVQDCDYCGFTYEDDQDEEHNQIHALKKMIEAEFNYKIDGYETRENKKREARKVLKDPEAGEKGKMRAKYKETIAHLDREIEKKLQRLNQDIPDRMLIESLSKEGN